MLCKERRVYCTRCTQTHSRANRSISDQTYGEQSINGSRLEARSTQGHDDKLPQPVEYANEQTQKDIGDLSKHWHWHWQWVQCTMPVSDRSGIEGSLSGQWPDLVPSAASSRAQPIYYKAMQSVSQVWHIWTCTMDWRPIRVALQTASLVMKIRL